MTFRPEDLPRVAPWRTDGDGAAAVATFVEREVGASAAVALTALFWPRFVDVDGAVLRADGFTPDSLRGWRASLGSDVRAIEEVVNHVHLWDLFDLDADPVPADALLHLGGVLAETWLAALRAQFPARRFDVRLESGDDQYGPTIYAVSAEVDER